MKFISYQAGGLVHVGLLDAQADRVWPLRELAPDAGDDMIGLIERYDEIKGRLRPNGPGLALSDVQVLAPIPVPRRNIFCVGKNYRAHATEVVASRFGGKERPAEDSVPDVPIFFTKAPSCVIGDGASIVPPPGFAEHVDYEAELAAVIGKRGRGIAPQAAHDHVWGYTILNDVTARDLQARHQQWFLGKSADGFCPMGPWIATVDEVDAANLPIRCWVNDELRQDARTSELIFDVPTLIATLSAVITLEPGDIIATGTPAGVGAGFDPPRFLKAGDRVRIAIEGLGCLNNPVR